MVVERQALRSARWRNTARGLRMNFVSVTIAYVSHVLTCTSFPLVIEGIVWNGFAHVQRWCLRTIRDRYRKYGRIFRNGDWEIVDQEPCFHAVLARGRDA